MHTPRCLFPVAPACMHIYKMYTVIGIHGQMRKCTGKYTEVWQRQKLWDIAPACCLHREVSQAVPNPPLALMQLQKLPSTEHRVEVPCSSAWRGLGKWKDTFTAYNMTALSFCQWVNETLLEQYDLSANLPRRISLHTATRWLHHLCFHPQSHKKGVYVDGHEREDVTKAKHLHELKTSHLPPPPCSDEHPAPPTPWHGKS